MLSVLILLLLLVPPRIGFLFGNLGGGGSCGCPCPATLPPPPPVCAPAPVCAQPAPCPSQPSYSYNYNSYASPTPSPYYQPGWMPAIPASPSYAQPPPSPPPPPSYPSLQAPPASYSTSYASNPAPLSIPSSPSYVAPVPATSYSIAPPILTAPIPLPPPIPPSPVYETIAPSYFATDDYEEVVPTTPSTTYLRSGYVPAPTNYPKSSSYESSPDDLAVPLIPPPPPPPLDPSYPMKEISITPQTFVYSTSEVLQPAGYSPGYVPPPPPTTSYMAELDEDGLIEKQGYWPKASGDSTKYDPYDKRHNILKRMKVETAKPENSTLITRTNNTCNSIKLANVMMRAIVDDVSVSKRMIQHSTKLAFDGAKFDVFCATGEFSYSIHSRKYCEVSKDEVTCFAFR